jgi:hypothetical protein
MRTRGAGRLIPSDFTTSVIALACWRAARSELHQVMLAVAMTFKNRSAAIGLDTYQTASAWLEDNPEGFPDVRDPQFQQLVAKLDAVLDGRVPDKTDGALWFVPKSKLESGVLKPFTITTTIGGLVFAR